MRKGGSRVIAAVAVLAVIVVGGIAFFGYSASTSAVSSSSPTFSSKTQQTTQTCNTGQISTACPFGFNAKDGSTAYGLESGQTIPSSEFLSSEYLSFLGSAYNTKTTVPFLRVSLDIDCTAATCLRAQDLRVKVLGIIAQYAGVLDQDRVAASQALSQRILSAGIQGSLEFYVGTPCYLFNVPNAGGTEYGSLHSVACKGNPASNEKLAIVAFTIATLPVVDSGNGFMRITPSSITGLPNLLALGLPGEMALGVEGGESLYASTGITTPFAQAYPEFSHTSDGPRTCCWVAPIQSYSSNEINSFNSLLMQNQVSNLATRLNSNPSANFFVSTKFENLLTQLVLGP